MCFVLYAGTTNPMSCKEWESDARDLSVSSLTEREFPVKGHFSKPEVQYIGSTSGCGCDFPHVCLQNGEWTWFGEDEPDPKQEASDRYNREALAALLEATGEQMVELYGVWDGDFAAKPKVREAITLKTILESDFRFKEQGFYIVKVDSNGQ